MVGIVGNRRTWRRLSDRQDGDTARLHETKVEVIASEDAVRRFRRLRIECEGTVESNQAACGRVEKNN